MNLRALRDSLKYKDAAILNAAIADLIIDELDDHVEEDGMTAEEFVVGVLGWHNPVLELTVDTVEHPKSKREYTEEDLYV